MAKKRETQNGLKLQSDGTWIPVFTATKVAKPGKPAKVDRPLVSDADVIMAFVNHGKADSKKIGSDGKKLTGQWGLIAAWKGKVIHLSTATGKTMQSQQRLIRKLAPVPCGLPAKDVTVSDRAVIVAFVNHGKADSKKIGSDGKRLTSQWGLIAEWKGKVIHLPPATGKIMQSRQRLIRKLAGPHMKVQ